VKILRILGTVLLALAVLAGLAWLLRSDPVGPISGRALRGEEAAYPDDWRFSDAHTTIALEARPDDPHSVTTICFVHEGVLHVPAQGGSGKRWTHYVVEDPRVRLKVGDTVYPARAIRVEDADPTVYLASAARKYPQVAEAGDELPEDIWLFRIEPRD
jgi:hypothetical protein